ncbi:MAG: amidohydrolase [Bacteroidota bacterium]
MKSIVAFLALILLLNFSCTPKQPELSVVQLTENTNMIFEELVQIRRDLHQYPELAGQEKRTAKIVEDYLLDLGLEVKKGFAGYGLVGILNGDKKGKKIAWRADMDAIDLRTMGNLHYPKSKNPGAAHLCGHDVHTTIGLGIANVLSKLKHHIEGTVYFVFQPAEETFQGAKTMVEDGLFEAIHPDEMYGLHVFPMEVGSVATKPEELFAYERKIKITFDKSLDQEEFNIFFKTILQELVRHKPESTPWSLEHLTHSKHGIENPNTIYKDYFFSNPTIQVFEDEKSIAFESTFFETDGDRLARISKHITDTIVRSKFGDSYVSTSALTGNPTVQNDPDLAKVSLQTLQNVFGDKHIKPLYGQVPYFNEDFVYFQQKIPGVMFFLGSSNEEKGITTMPHTPEFGVDEEAIRHGVTYFSTLLASRINQKDALGNGMHTPWLSSFSNAKIN